MAALGEKSIEEIPEKAWKLLSTIFQSKERLYETIYLIVKNGHLTEQDKTGNWEQRLDTIRWIQEKAEALLDRAGTNGKEIVADVANDYFEDFVQYKERECHMSNEDFLNIIKTLQHF